MLAAVHEIETDYLVVGAGAAGMAFVDALVAERDCEVVIVDRRHAPGGHWNDAYPFVRLHQPSATYGLNSRALGTARIDTVGSNAGFYERATAAEICDHFQRGLDDLVASAKVRFVGMSDYVGPQAAAHVIRSRLTGRTTSVQVRRAVVDATYLETSVPATHTPSFTVDADARVIPVGGLVAETAPAPGYTVLGAGKTAMDACVWLLDNGVDPDRIRWVKPRDAWLLDRASFQPLDLVVPTIEGFSRGVEALALADGAVDPFRRLEACGQLQRLDATVEPTMFRGAILDARERAALAQVERIVRLGRVRRVGARELVLEGGAMATPPGEVHVDCTACGFRSKPPRPIFKAGRITLQSMQGGFTTYNAALLGYVEATRTSDGEKNRLCSPTPQPNAAIDWVAVFAGSMRSAAVHSTEPDLVAWIERSRLSLTRGLAAHLTDPRLQVALGRMAESTEPALRNASRLLETQRPKETCS